MLIHGGSRKIANIHRIIEKAREFQKNNYFSFSDYAKAFDFVDHHKLWKVVKEIGVPDHLICLLRNLSAGQEATVRTRCETRDWFQIWKIFHQHCIVSPCLFNLYAEYIMWNAGLDEAQLESRVLGEISITSDMQMTPALWQKLKRNWIASWWKWKRRVKYWLKTQHSQNEDYGIWFHHFMANIWGNKGDTERLSFLGLQNHYRW